jgi:hypothetical protein
MKKTALLLAVFVFCAAMAFAAGPINGEWSGENDSGDGGTSTITMTQVTMDGMPAYRFVGKVTQTGYEWSYLNAQLVPDADSKKAMSSARAVSFKVRGNGEKYWFCIGTTDVKDWGYHRYSFQTTAGETTTVRVPINLMRQPDWALAKRLQLVNTDYIQWNNFTSGAPSDFELTIWDVKFE